MFSLLKFATMLKDSPFMGTQTVQLKMTQESYHLGSF